ncbi:MAG TPA: isochorismatase family cysteine hydrolase [Casimicrobiaceae bacterium]|nr:isochorismatase family cysteine hydrolase [Casimicrobiaceae bacterium]
MTALRACGQEAGARRGEGGKTALLLVDFINELDFAHGEALRPYAEAAARRTADVKRRLKALQVPAIYANDNFGRWKSNFPDLVASCRASRSRGRELARLLAPDQDDLSVLKPRHSAFYGTPLDFLLAELAVDRLVIVGLVTEMCVLFTAQDAYVRKFEMWIPEDCVASVEPEVHARTLTHCRDVLGIDTRASTEMKLEELLARPTGAATDAASTTAAGCRAS